MLFRSYIYIYIFIYVYTHIVFTFVLSDCSRSPDSRAREKMPTVEQVEEVGGLNKSKKDIRIRSWLQDTLK